MHIQEEDVFNTINQFFTKRGIKWEMYVGIITDDGMSMLGYKREQGVGTYYCICLAKYLPEWMDKTFGKLVNVTPAFPAYWGTMKGNGDQTCLTSPHWSLVGCLKERF